MAVARTKDEVVNELVEELKNSGGVYIAEYKGISVATVSKLRRTLHDNGLQYKVYKNSLVKRAIKEVGGIDEKAFDYLHNQNGFIFAKEDLGKPAKILKDFLKENKQPSFKAAIIDGTVFGGDQLDALSSMKSKNEIIGDILGLLLSPISNVVGALQAQGGNILGAVKTIAEKES